MLCKGPSPSVHWQKHTMADLNSQSGEVPQTQLSAKVPARKSAKKKAARKKVAKKKTARPQRKKNTNARKKKKRSWLTVLLFWPFLLLGHLTRDHHPILKWPFRMVGAVGIFFFLCGVVGALFYGARSLRYDLAMVDKMPARTIVYARDGRTELGRLHGDNRYIVTHDQVAADFKNALISREDTRFYSHLGVDLRSLLRAAVENYKRRSFAQGGSTLSIQLAENTYFQPDSTIKKSKLRLFDQKFLEIALALRIEANFEKNEILEHYMNRIFWGHSIRGIESASRTYFEKPARQLSLSEAAMLAGIIRGPNAFSPFKSIEKATRERDVTLGRMVHYGHITQAQADEAKSQALDVRPKNRRVVQPSYVMDALRRELDRILEEENIQSGGLNVITTVDHTIQRAAELSVERNLAKVEKKSGYRHQTRSQWLNTSEAKRGDPAYLQGACVVIKNDTGEVLAVVGGRNANESKYNRAIQAERQIGSIFKPFVYLSAFSKGMMPETWVRDSRIQPGEIKGAERSWSPGNSDGKYGGFITAEDALVRSRNTSSVRVGNFAGLNSVAQTALDVGFVEPYSGKPLFTKNPSSYLGSWEATPWQVASAYTVFPNHGDWYRPYLIQEIRNARGERLYPGKGDSGKLVVIAADSGASWSVSKTLEQVVDRGTGRNVRNLGFTAPCAGKTGTTDNYKDAWFAGYTANITCAVWVGLDKPEKIINGGYGSTLAAPIWTDVMKTAGRLSYKTPPFKSVTVKQVDLCRWSGKRATSGCAAKGAAYRAQVPIDMLPSANNYCTIHPLRAVPVNQSRNGSVPKTAPRAIPIDEAPRAILAE